VARGRSGGAARRRKRNGTSAAATKQDDAVSAVPTCAAALGAEVRGVELHRVTDTQFATIHQAWLDHFVLLFGGRSLADDDLIAFSRRFGDFHWALGGDQPRSKTGDVSRSFG
jgi:alpha-ketoglutarate-dependent taurine dioxygenase